jgi:hypothetical protein
MLPKFQAGQTVRFASSFPHRHAAEGVYEVIRRLPSEDGDYQYRIKSARELYQRVVNESDIERA